MSVQDDGILIRVKNRSDYKLDDVIITSGSSGDVAFGSLTPHRTSEYKKFKRAYRIAAISARIGEEAVSFLPDDYIGEHPLKAGHYTYEITVEVIKNEKYLRLKFLTP